MNNDILFFVKFGKKVHMESMLKGNIHFSNAKTFRKIEEDQYKKGQGDKNDSMFNVLASKVKITPNTSSSSSIELIDQLLNIDFWDNPSKATFCIMAGTRKACSYYHDETDYKIKFSDLQANIIKEHFPQADSVLLIKNPISFIENVYNNIGHACYSHKVLYYNKEHITKAVIDIEEVEINEDGFIKKYYMVYVSNEYLHKHFKNEWRHVKIENAQETAQKIAGKFDAQERTKKLSEGKAIALVETKNAVLNIEMYKNILVDGINGANRLLTVLEMLPISTKEEKQKAVTEFIYSILYNSVYPEGYKKEFEIEYEDGSKILIINYKMPNMLQVPRTIGCKYNVAFEQVVNSQMKDKEFYKYYESILFQITLRSINEIFVNTSINVIESIVFNGWLDTIDRKTGSNFSSCIISLMILRKEFEKLNLIQVSLKDCILYLKGIIAGPLYMYAPVKPIMDIDRNDRRFVNTKDVLTQLDSSVNLAEMNWEDFEHLVRELFEKIFSNEGSEVKVTQASRDGGVDAIAFDNDPIKGGKFVIQAKRYNNVVPVSAARDLYGTVINEGAVKGILVTTSYYGNDSIEFTKNKPLTLIDGSNLVYLLNKYGYKTHIELKNR